MKFDVFLNGTPEICHGIWIYEMFEHLFPQKDMLPVIGLNTLVTPHF